MRGNFFNNKKLALLLLLPQLVITFVFFLWPALQAFIQSLYGGDAFGVNKVFIGLSNYLDIFYSSAYVQSFKVTIAFSFFVTLFTQVGGLIMAYLVNSVGKGKGIYKTLLIWPYAVAPAVAGILWRFIFNPSVGWASYLMSKVGYDWNYLIYPKQAFFLVVLASCWQQFSYNFLFYLAALQAIPKSLIEASSIDGSNAFYQLKDIVIPLLGPTSFFLLLTNLIFSFFDTFGVIQIITQGGPAGATATLVYKVYNDGFVGLDYGGSAAQSVILMLVISLLMFLQFRYIDKKVHY